MEMAGGQKHGLGGLLLIGSTGIAGCNALALMAAPQRGLNPI